MTLLRSIQLTFIAIMVTGTAAFSAKLNGGTTELYPILGRPDEFTESATKGVKLAVRRWLPSSGSSPKAVVVFHHGGAGFHSGYSDIMGRSLSKAGIAVVAFDTAGCGYSDGPRNYFDSIETVCNHYTKVLNQVKDEYPGIKTFAMGESWGGHIVLAQSLLEQEKLDKGEQGSLADGYILTGPVIKLLPEMLPPKPALVVLNILAKLLPKLTMPGTDFFSTFDLAFGDKVWAKTGRNDPIIQEAAEHDWKLGQITSFLKSVKKVNSSFESVNVPLKILMGENEGRVDTDAVKQLAKDASSDDKDLEIVPGAYHQLFQDLPEVTDGVCQSVVKWVLERA